MRSGQIKRKEADLPVKRTATASTSRSGVSQRTNLSLVGGRRRAKLDRSNSLSRRVLWTVLALLVLGVVLRYLPVKPAPVSAQALSGAALSSPSDLHVSSVQISQPPAGDAVYVDGLVTNAGSARVTGATAEVQFRDARGNVIASVQKPMVGMAHGGTDLIGNELARNPIKSNEMRFFRIAVEEVPPAWNHEVPELKIVAVKAR
jgi:hypothetical protein